MKYFLVACILLSGVFMAAETKPKYQPTEVQALRLKVSQQQAALAQKDLFIAQQNFQQAVMLLQAEGEKVKQENKWDAGVIFNAENLSFIDPPRQVSPETK